LTPLDALDALVARRTGVTLRARGAGRTGGPHSAVRSGSSGVALDTLDALVAGIALGARRAGIALDTLNALDALLAGRDRREEEVRTGEQHERSRQQQVAAVEAAPEAAVDELRRQQRDQRRGRLDRDVQRGAAVREADNRRHADDERERDRADYHSGQPPTRTHAALVPERQQRRRAPAL